MVTCPVWDWFVVLDLKLLEEQGAEVTRMQRADVEGLKFWRKTPRGGGKMDEIRGEEGEGSGDGRRKRDGYWIHVELKDTQLDYGGELLFPIIDVTSWVLYESWELT